MGRTFRLLAATTVTAGALAACGSSSTPPPAVASTPAPACPAVSVAPVSWPGIVPADLPKPPGAVLTGETVQNHVVYLHFTTSASLREGLLFVLRELPKAGYTIGRGDAELTEADVPFTSPSILAAMRLMAAGRCSTAWTLAVARRASTGTTGLSPGALIPHPTPSGTSPLPFG